MTFPKTGQAVNFSDPVGSVVIADETLEGVFPMWCAAAAGHLNVVRALHLFKASLNSTTKANSTPLRAACYHGHESIVKYLVQNGADIEIANKYGHTPLMISCRRGHYEIARFLVYNGANLNRKTLKGKTALHACAESGHLDILKLLLHHHAVFDVDASDITPLLSASMNGRAQIVDYFIQEFSFSKQDKINAVQLLGATFMDKHSDMMKAYQYWRLAVKWRCEDLEYHHVNPEAASSVVASVDAQFSTSFMGVSEAYTFAQLEEIFGDPDKMQVHALIVRENILGCCHPQTCLYVQNRGYIYAHNGDVERFMQLWMYRLEVYQELFEPFSRGILKLFKYFNIFLAVLMCKASANELHIPIPAKQILVVLQKLLKEMERAFEISYKSEQKLTYRSEFHEIMLVAMHLVLCICVLKSQLNGDDLDFKRAVYKLIKMNPLTRNGSTPLHVACVNLSHVHEEYFLHIFPSSIVVNLLLEVGACPNTVDFDKNTPLHVAAMNQGSCTLKIIKALLNHGAHLDQRNREKKTPLYFIRRAALPGIYPLRYTSLQCLCAQAIQRRNIPYKGKLHKKLEAFIDTH
ncbi:protein fem-1 homolog A-like [Stegodyphus dumicola]|uniref:protein fem-1 homolog A-like n=1 Tax=Stegodyphus dumicola TaxID=202533 RepID=UPI0015AB6E84|nr:protein fem-1 homolog A-like [Stegodyphus dumicola]